MTINVGVIDDQELVRIAVQEILNRDSDINFVGGFSGVGTLLEADENIDVLLLGDTLPHTNSFETIARLSETRPNLRVIVLGRQWTSPDVQAALECGAMGVMDRDELLHDLLAAGVRRVHLGQRFLSPAVATLAYTETPPDNPLTERELDVVRLMRNGATPKAIGVELGVKTRTVYRYQDKIRLKLGVQTTQQIVFEAIQRGLV